MKKILSIMLALVALFSVFSVAFTSEAASRPGKVSYVDAYQSGSYAYAKWPKKKGVSGYQVQYGTVTSSGKLKWKSKKYKVKASKRSHRVKSTRYAVVRVRAYKGKSYGKWTVTDIVWDED